ncbi:MAG: ectoine hydroxylase-related dioxygenase (phytanoyl-CoA dioxygenase family) [Candidatus Azotimanducaceae bacterium]|jgi:ectoine hydroxylase-related dioxygenase (phytanoyl-CoA dioxygenase family)
MRSENWVILNQNPTGPYCTDMTEYPMKLNQDKITEFESRGFVVTDNVLTVEELKRYGEAVDDEVALRTQADARRVTEKTTYEQSFIQCMRLWETNRVICELSCHSKLAGIAAQLLSEPEILLWQDQALYKEAGGRETTAHQDQPFWPIGDAPLVSAWIPLCDVTVSTGAMAYVPGSHKAGKLKIVDITHSTEPYDILRDPALNGATPETVEVTAGSVVWHHGFTVHQAGANLSAQTRRVFTTVYLARGYRRANPWPVYPLDRAGINAGELMEGVGMPQVWPPQAGLPAQPTNRGQLTGPQHGK